MWDRFPGILLVDVGERPAGHLIGGDRRRGIIILGGGADDVHGPNLRTSFQ